jgi:hypothetical protein
MTVSRLAWADLAGKRGGRPLRHAGDVGLDAEMLEAEMLEMGDGSLRLIAKLGNF